MDQGFCPVGRIGLTDPAGVSVHCGDVPLDGFQLTGGSNSKGLHVTPAEGYMLVNSSFTSTSGSTPLSGEGVSNLEEVLRSGKTYFVILGEGAEKPDVWRFSFDLLPRKKNTNMHDPAKKQNLELAVVSLYNHGSCPPLFLKFKYSGPNQHSPELAALRQKIHERRADPSSNWRWLMTLVAGTAEVKVYKF